MTGTASTWGLGRITSGANDVVYVPRTPPQGRRAIIACHGYLGTSRVFLDDPPSPNTAVFARQLAARGFLVISVDVGNTWGNAAAVARIEQARAYAVTLGAAPTVNLLAISMGNFTAWGYQRDHTGSVGAIGSIMPASDLDDLYNNNRAASQASIAAAWGVVAPAALPGGANPLVNDNLVAVPYSAWYSTADTVVLPATVEAFAAKVKGSATIISTSADHGDVMLPSVSIDDVSTWFTANGS